MPRKQKHQPSDPYNLILPSLDLWNREKLPDSIKDVWDHDPEGHSWLDTLRVQFKLTEKKVERLTTELEQAHKKIKKLEDDLWDAQAEAKEAM